jgi:steroid 5-alpha reductase family enzyme
VFGSGALLVAVAALLRTWGTSYLQAEVMRDAHVRTERLLADGPYRYTRNPLYLGNIFMAMGLGLMASRTGFVVLTTGLTVFLLRLILREETELREHQGEAFLRYCAAVPRLLPSLSPRVPPAGNTPRWEQALRAESMYWLMALAMAAFAITLNLKIFWGVFAAAMAAAFLSKRPETKPDSHPRKPEGLSA